MVTALPPQRFLAGENGCGDALNDVELRLLPNRALGCGRLAWRSEAGHRCVGRRSAAFRMMLAGGDPEMLRISVQGSAFWVVLTVPFTPVGRRSS